MENAPVFPDGELHVVALTVHRYSGPNPSDLGISRGAKLDSLPGFDRCEVVCRWPAPASLCRDHRINPRGLMPRAVLMASRAVARSNVSVRLPFRERMYRQS